jgi:hypothetical protein
MLKHLYKWFAASLVIPAITMVLAPFINYTIDLQMLTLALWPSGIFLMSLGGGQSALSEVISVWFLSVGCNVILYGIVGSLFYLLCSYIKKSSNAKL